MNERQIGLIPQTPRRRRQRSADAELTIASAGAHHLVRGFTLIELLVTAGIMGVLMAIAMPIMPRSNYALWNAQEQLIADLRATRMDALTKGDHFRFDITGTNTYTESRMNLVGTNWVVGTTVRSRKLPNGVTFSGAGNSFEFNTRGLMLNPGAAATLTMTDSATTHSKSITVWPSGQVTPS